MTLKVSAHLLPDDDVKLASGAVALFGEIGLTLGVQAGCSDRDEKRRRPANRWDSQAFL